MSCVVFLSLLVFINREICKTYVIRKPERDLEQSRYNREFSGAKF